jgi:hypothetical protein
MMVPDRAALGYLAADAISLAAFVPLGVVACVLPRTGAGAGRADAARLVVLAGLTVCAAFAVLPAWTDSMRTALAAGALLLTLAIGVTAVLDDDERAALRTLKPWRGAQ